MNEHAIRRRRDRRRRSSRCSPIPRPMAARQVKRIDTHAASVFLAGDRALKVKRAVRFPFLDYSTLDKRKAACEAELAINRPFAPGHLSPRGRRSRARRTDGSRSTATASRSNGRSRCAASTRTRRSTISPTPGRSTPRSPTRSAARWRRRMPMRARGRRRAAGSPRSQSYIERARRGLRASAGPVSGRGERSAFADASRAAFARIRPLLRRARAARAHPPHPRRPASRQYRAARRPAGAVRRHRVRADVIASGDVLYDLAFLLMDLVERGLDAGRQHRAQPLSRRDQARRGSRRARGAAVLPVDARGDPRQGDGGAARARRAGRAKRRSQRSARTYFDWARRFIAPAPPMLVAVGGLSGTGKSVLARALAPDARRRRRARSCCAPTSSARRCSARTSIEQAAARRPMRRR